MKTSEDGLVAGPMLNLDRVVGAGRRIAGHVVATPVMTSETLNSECGAKLFFKCENLQETGSFKARGAANAILSLTDIEAVQGVATHSSGNHGAALAWAAKRRGIPAWIVMPANAPAIKRANVERYGGRIAPCEPSIEGREAAVAGIIAETGAILVHPYDDLDVMAGQGTATLELLEQVADLDLILCPVSGGGLLSGTLAAAKGIKPDIRVIGVEPAGADDARRSIASGRRLPSLDPATVADALRGSLGPLTFAEIRDRVDDIVTVSDDAIMSATRQIIEALKIVVEPSGAVPLAAVHAGDVDVAGRRIGILLSGGNLDVSWFCSQLIPEGGKYESNRSSEPVPAARGEHPNRSNLDVDIPCAWSVKASRSGS